MSDPEFVTIAEAAKALNLSERQVRRYAGRLAESDRLPAKSVRPGDRPTPDMMTGPCPARVRLSALALLAGKGIVEGNAPNEASGFLPEVTGASPAYAGHDDRPIGKSVRLMSGVVSEDLASLREQLAAVTADRDGLTARLADTQADRDAWKEQAREAIELARVAQDEVRSARLVGQRPMQQIESHAASAGDSGEVLAPGGALASEEPKRGFWARLWGRG